MKIKVGDQVEFIFKYDMKRGTVVACHDNFYDIEFDYYGMFSDVPEKSIYSINFKDIIKIVNNE